LDAKIAPQGVIIASEFTLPTFIHLNRNPRLLKTDVPPGMFAAQVVRPAVGVLLYAWGGVLGWFIHPAVAVAIFIFMVCYYAATSCGVRADPLKIDRDPSESLTAKIKTRS